MKKILFLVLIFVYTISFASDRNFKFNKTEDKISLINKDKIVWQFNFSKENAKTYFYPLATIDGVNLVAESPEDHIWHNGLFFQWKYIEKLEQKGNKKYLFWEPRLGVSDKGKIELGSTNSELKSVEFSDEDYSAEIVLNVFYNSEGRDNGTALLVEERSLKISSPDKNGTYFIDWNGKFTAMKDIILSSSDVKNLQGGYAGLALRMGLNIEDAQVFNLSGGKITEYNSIDQMKTCMDKRSPAIATNGTFDGVKAGIVLIESRDSDRAFSPNYCVFRKVGKDKNLKWIFTSIGYLRGSPKVLKKGEVINLKYRVIVHSGFWNLKKVELAEKSFNALYSESDKQKALDNASLANEGFIRCDNLVKAWLDFGTDKKTGLVRRNLNKSNFWNAKDSAADNYPYMVITSFFTDKKRFNGRMIDILETEKRLTSRVGACPDDFDFVKQGFKTDDPNMPMVIFGSCEYIKDGLIPIAELLGETPWSNRMYGILDDLQKIAPDVPSIRKYWDLKSTHELSGDLLQSLSRLYWMSGKNKKYLDWAIKIADVYLLDESLESKEFKLANSDMLGLRDHGCEVINGLCELYVTLHFVNPAKKEEYKEPLYELMDKILKVSRNEDGLFYDRVDLKNEKPIRKNIADTWGYILDGYYAIYQVDKHEPYRDAVLKVLKVLNEKYRNFCWGGSFFWRQSALPENYKREPWKNSNHDDYADSIESAINMYNRERVESVEEWIDSQIKVHWAFQLPSGIIEGWHGDGNFARTAIMYVLWKTQGTYLSEWRRDICYGGVSRNEKSVYIVLSALDDWEGKLHFDFPRYRDNMKMPLDWSRINQFPQWFTVYSEKEYQVNIDGKISQMSGKSLIEGIDISLNRCKEHFVEVQEIE